MQRNRYSVPCDLVGQMVSVRVYPQRVEVAVELVLESGAVSAEHVINVVGRLKPSVPLEQVETLLQVTEVPVADTGRYDRLRDEDSTEEVRHA